jgi:hypothetical protein
MSNPPAIRDYTRRERGQHCGRLAERMRPFASPSFCLYAQGFGPGQALAGLVVTCGGCISGCAASLAGLSLNLAGRLLHSR